MPGQIPLDIRYYPGDFQYTSWTIHEPKHDRYPVMFTDRNVVIDSIGVFVEDSVNQNITIKLVAAPQPNVPDYTTPITGQVDLTTGLALATGGTYPLWATTAGTAGFTLNRSNNLLMAPKGLWLVSSGHFAGVAGNLHVQVRWRSTF
jgi:hypothetical protein